MALFAVTLSDETTDVVEGADAYQQEGPLTTFFAFQSNRRVIDSWSVRMASYRTADIAAIRRSAEASDRPDGVDLFSQLDSQLDRQLDSEARTVLASA